MIRQSSKTTEKKKTKIFVDYDGNNGGLHVTIKE